MGKVQYNLEENLCKYIHKTFILALFIKANNRSNPSIHKNGTISQKNSEKKRKPGAENTYNKCHLLSKTCKNILWWVKIHIIKVYEMSGK